MLGLSVELHNLLYLRTCSFESMSVSEKVIQCLEVTDLSWCNLSQ